jgi:hypothetical protein
MKQRFAGRIAIRSAQTSESGKIDDLLMLSYSALLQPVYSADVMAAALPLMVRSNPRLIASGLYYVALLNDELVGCGGWSI